MRTTLSTLILHVLHGETCHRLNCFKGTPHMSIESYPQGSRTTAFILPLMRTAAAFGHTRIARDREPFAPRLARWGGWLAPLSLMRAWSINMETPPTLYVVRGGRTPHVTEFICALSEAWRRYAPVLPDQQARAVLRVAPASRQATLITATFSKEIPTSPWWAARQLGGPVTCCLTMGCSRPSARARERYEGSSCISWMRIRLMTHR